MKSKIIAPFSNLRLANWKNLLLFVIMCFTSIYLVLILIYGSVGDDYLAFWSAGKIADRKGYSEIYNLTELRSVQRQVRIELGGMAKMDDLLFSPTPVPYFSFFILPFQFLSRISVMAGYRIWTILNLALLMGYLYFFLRRITPESSKNNTDLKLLIPMVISYSVFYNITCGQVEVFVLICAGEFLRNAVKKKPLISGLWLGCLLIKPQLLILIIPIFILMRNWKALIGFFVSSGLFLATSLLLSGLAGIRALINLWTKYSAGIETTAPERMINWRMVGVNLNNLFNTSLGWLITGLGIGLTILAVYFLIKHNAPYGSSSWVITMGGVFSATLAITWHSHYHMAMVLIPFLVYASIKKIMPDTVIILWGVTTPVVFFGMLIYVLFFSPLINVNSSNQSVIAIAFLGLTLNLLILISATQTLKIHSSIKN